MKIEIISGLGWVPRGCVICGELSNESTAAAIDGDKRRIICDACVERGGDGFPTMDEINAARQQANQEYRAWYEADNRQSSKGRMYGRERRWYSI